MTIATALIGNTTANIYASTGNSAITWLSINSYGSGNVTANVYVVPSGGSAGNANVILASIELTALDTYQLYAGGEKLLLDTGDTVRVNANANNAITTVVSYTTI